MSNMTVNVPEAVAERVHEALVKSFLETPDYINQVVKELMKQKDNIGFAHNNPDYGKPLFEVILRRHLRTMIERSMLKALAEKYEGVIDKAVRENVDQQEKLDGSLAQAFAKILGEEWKVHIDTNFVIKSLSRD